MNTSTQNIAALREIHLPDPISWWPPAIGWWLLLALVIATAILLPILYRRLTYTPINKVINKSFQDIVARYKDDNDAFSFISQTSRFLRQIAMTYYGRDEVAQLTGDKWMALLNNLSKSPWFTDEVQQNLLNAPYQKIMQIDPELVISVVQNWLAGLPKQPPRLKK